jgi:hypothetical protein
MQVCKYEDGASMSQIILIRYLTQEHYWFLFQIFLVSVVCVFYQFVAKTLKICKFLIGTFRPKMGLLPEKIQVAKFFLNHVFFSFFFFYVCSLVPVFRSGSIRLNSNAPEIDFTLRFPTRRNKSRPHPFMTEGAPEVSGSVLQLQQNRSHDICRTVVHTKPAFQISLARLY